MNSNKIKYTLIPIIGFALMPVAMAQTIKKDVEVVKPYEPSVSDAFKINELPQIKDSVLIKPTFQYNISPSPLQSSFQLQPINAAKMVSMPIPKLYKSYLTLGFGNYTSPMGELYINSLRSKSYSAGFYFKHQSSNGRVKLDDGRKVDAGYADNRAELFGKKFYKNGEVQANLYYSGNKLHYYGYKTEDTTIMKPLNTDSIRQNYSLLGASFNIGSTISDSSRLHYLGNVTYNHFSDRWNRAENQVLIDVTGSKLYTNKYIGLNTRVNYLTHNTKLDTTGFANTLVHIAPWAELNTSQYKLHVGLALDFATQNDQMKVKLSPVADFQFVVYEDVIIPFLGISGGIQQHSYRDIVAENPFVKPDTLFLNSKDKLTFYGGVKGSMGRKASYVLKLNYRSTANQHFFVNDTSTQLQNMFVPVYADADILNGYAEINYDVTEELSLSTRCNLYQYTLTTEAKPWHKPGVDFTLESQYNLKNKIILNLGITAIGKRYALQNNNVEKKLKPALDFNLNAEYRYSKVLSFWLSFNNFTAAKYQIWNQYPSQRFQLMGGFTYSL